MTNPAQMRSIATNPVDLGGTSVQTVVELDRWIFPAADLFPAIEPDAVAEAKRRWGPRFVDPESEELILSVHSYLVRTPGGRVILIDSCNGNHKPRPSLLPHHMLDTDYLGRLAAAGVGVEDVDLVLCTHLHPDHAGWNTRLIDGSWVPTFPNARYLIGRTDYDWLRGLHEEGPTEGIPADLAALFEDSVLPVVAAGQADIVEADHSVERELDHGIWLEPAPGHTEGHVVVHIEGRTGTAVATADVVHHPLQFEHLDLAQAGDADPEIAARTRRRLVESYAGTATTILPGHFPPPTACRLVERAGRLELAWVEP